MEPQRWNGSWRFDWKRPAFADTLTAGALFYLLHNAPGVHELAAAGIGLAALRCIRWIRITA
ncbi:hypothetical protein ACFYZI_41455 [Streptomyces griseorubiginosus]|uniref:hypothetical protein n=1 Tax=Streptomyces griseorubiginosus TaxID=67304 RepID=UPI003684D5EA